MVWLTKSKFFFMLLKILISVLCILRKYYKKILKDFHELIACIMKQLCTALNI